MTKNNALHGNSRPWCAFCIGTLCPCPCFFCDDRLLGDQNMLSQIPIRRPAVDQSLHIAALVLALAPGSRTRLARASRHAVAIAIAIGAAAWCRADPGRNLIAVVVQAGLLKIDAARPARVEAVVKVGGAGFRRHDGVVVRAAANRLVARVARSWGRRRIAPARAPGQAKGAARAPAAAARVQRVLVEVLRHFGAEAQARQTEGEEVADRGQAGAEDGAVDFDHGPDGCIGPVPGRVVSADDDRKGGCADNRDDAGAVAVLVRKYTSIVWSHNHK